MLQSHESNIVVASGLVRGILDSRGEEMRSGRWLYLPIETPVRETDAKLLLAIHAANSGYHVVFGTKALLRLLLARALPPGILLYKSSHPDFFSFRTLGHRIVVHDEEGLVLLSDAESYRRFSVASLQHVDLYLCWGQAQQAIVERAAAEHGFDYRVVSVGHPRLDLLHPRFRGGVPARREKPCILINTKLAEYNHIRGYDGWLDILIRSGVVTSSDEVHFRKRQRDYKERLFRHYIDLVEYLAGRFTQCEIVLRPHPSEDLAVWARQCARFGNVVVTNIKSVGHWIQQADIAIHTACTTGIESALLGCPTVSYHPEHAKEFSSDLPDRVSVSASKKEEVGAVVADHIANRHRDQALGNGIRDEAVQELTGHITNLAEGNSHVAIVDELDRLDVPTKGLTGMQTFGIRARSAGQSFRRGVRGAPVHPILPSNMISERMLELERCYAGSGVALRTLGQDVFVISRQGHE